MSLIADMCELLRLKRTVQVVQKLQQSTFFVSDLTVGLWEPDFFVLLCTSHREQTGLCLSCKVIQKSYSQSYNMNMG